MPRVGALEIIVVLVVVVLIFGIGRISKLGGELGSGIRAFKEGLSSNKENEDRKEEKEDKDIPNPS